jgi:hypothetical protein
MKKNLQLISFMASLVFITGCASMINPYDRRYLLISSDRIFAVALDDAQKLRQQGMTQFKPEASEASGTNPVSGKSTISKMTPMSLEVGKTTPLAGTQNTEAKADIEKKAGTQSVTLAEVPTAVPPLQMVTLFDDQVFGNLSIDPSRLKPDDFSPQFSQVLPEAVFGK